MDHEEENVERLRETKKSRSRKQQGGLLAMATLNQVLAVRMDLDHRVEPQPPLFPPMPLEPPGRWEPWSPEWCTYWMLGRVERRMERRAGRMTELERKKYWKRREILRSTLMILETNPEEIARLRAHHFCRLMTDLSVDEESPQGPDIPELPEPGAEPSERVE